MKTQNLVFREQKAVSSSLGEINKILESAKLRAQEIIEEAEAEAEKTLIMAKNKGDRIVEERLRQATSMVDSVKTKLNQEYANNLPNLVVEIVRDVVADEIISNRESVVKRVERALKYINKKEVLELRVNPEDYDLYESKFNALKDEFDNIVIKKCSSVEVGEGKAYLMCGSVILISCSSHLNRIKEVLQGMYDNER